MLPQEILTHPRRFNNWFVVPCFAKKVKLNMVPSTKIFQRSALDSTEHEKGSGRGRHEQKLGKLVKVY